MKKFIIVGIIALIFLLIVCNFKFFTLWDHVDINFAAYKNTDKLYLIKENNKYGYINGKGEVIIKPILNNARDFSDGLAAIRINNLFKQECFIDTSGKVVFNTDIDKTGDFFEGMAQIQNKEFPEPDYAFSERSYTDIQFGYINNLGKVIVKPIF